MFNGDRSVVALRITFLINGQKRPERMCHVDRTENFLQRKQLMYESSCKAFQEYVKQCDPIPWMVKWMLSYRRDTHIVTTFALIPYLYFTACSFIGTQAPQLECDDDDNQCLIIWIRVTPPTFPTKGSDSECKHIRANPGLSVMTPVLDLVNLGCNRMLQRDLI